MIIAVTLFIVFSARAGQPYTTQPELASRAMIESLSETKMKDISNPLVIRMLRDGNVTNGDNTVLQQVAEFHFTAREGHAFELLQNVTYGLVPPRYSFKVIINNHMVYNRTTSNENTSSIMVSAKKLVFGVVNRTALVYGPTLAEIRLWQ